MLFLLVIAFLVAGGFGIWLWRRRVYKKRFAEAEVLEVLVYEPSEEAAFRGVLRSAEWLNVFVDFEDYCDEGFAELTDEEKDSIRSRLAKRLLVARIDALASLGMNELNFSRSGLAQLIQYWERNDDEDVSGSIARFLGKRFRIDFRLQSLLDDSAR